MEMFSIQCRNASMDFYYWNAINHFLSLFSKPYYFEKDIDPPCVIEHDSHSACAAGL